MAKTMDETKTQIQRFRELLRQEANMNYDLRVPAYVEFLENMVRHFEDEMGVHLRDANIDMNRWTLNQ